MLRRIISLTLTIGMFFQQVSFAQVAVELNLASYLSRVGSTLTQERFRPPQLRYFSYDALSDNFKLLLDKGDIEKINRGHFPKESVPLSEQELKDTTQTLLNYFLVGVTLPDSMFWVNLRPDSEEQIIDQYLEKTDVGKVMLEADLQLKKDTASFTSPQTSEGKEYWTKLYKKAEELYGYDNVTIPTLTRPWIVPGEIIVRESTANPPSAYVYKAGLKVMLESDYLSSAGDTFRQGYPGDTQRQVSPGMSDYQFKDPRSKALNDYSTQLIKELIIPKLTREVNSAKRYANLRQVYYSLILARWFKLRFTGQAGTYASLINTKNLTSLISNTSWSKTDYFNQYKKSFAQGEYNIKEPVYTPTGQVIRSYFSGGISIPTGLIDNNINAGIISQSSPIFTNVPNTVMFDKNGISSASPVISGLGTEEESIVGDNGVTDLDFQYINKRLKGYRLIRADDEVVMIAPEDDSGPAFTAKGNLKIWIIFYNMRGSLTSYADKNYDSSGKNFKSKFREFADTFGYAASPISNVGFAMAEIKTLREGNDGLKDDNYSSALKVLIAVCKEYDPKGKEFLSDVLARAAAKQGATDEIKARLQLLFLGIFNIRPLNKEDLEALSDKLAELREAELTKRARDAFKSYMSGKGFSIEQMKGLGDLDKAVTLEELKEPLETYRQELVNTISQQEWSLGDKYAKQRSWAYGGRSAFLKEITELTESISRLRTLEGIMSHFINNQWQNLQGGQASSAISAEDLMVNIDYIMKMLKITDYPRIIETFKRSIDAKAFIEDLAKVSNKSPAEVSGILKDIPFFAPIAAYYSVKYANKLDKREFANLRMDVGVEKSGYSVSDKQRDIYGQPISDYLRLMRDAAKDVPFVFRDDMLNFVGRFLGREINNQSNPDLEDIIDIISGYLTSFGLSGIKYIFTSGIGANEMYSHELAMILNALFRALGIDVRWFVVNNAEHYKIILQDTPDANNENTVVFEMSRSGGTQETLNFFDATKDRFKKRIVVANPPEDEKKLTLNTKAKILQQEPGASVLIIGDTPGDIGGRQMNRKTLMTYAPLFVALAVGLKDVNKAKEQLKIYVNSLYEANEELSYDKGANSKAIRLAEFLFRHRESGRNKFSVIYDNALKASSKELFQLLNEGANKNIAGGTNDNILDSYSLQNDENKYATVFNKAGHSQVVIFLLDTNSKDYNSALAYADSLREEGIPAIVISTGLSDDLTANLQSLARLTALLQDMVVYFTYITKQDANSNPAVKFVREITTAMFAIVKNKKAAGAKDIRITLNEVLEAIKKNNEKGAIDAKTDIGKLNVQQGNYNAEFSSFEQALKELSDKLGLSDKQTVSSLLQSISRGVVMSDVGEAGGAKIANINEAFSRSAMIGQLGKATPDPVIASLDKQQILAENKNMKVSVALEQADESDYAARTESLSVKLADYLFNMYQQRKGQYITLSFTEADENNPIIKEISDYIIREFSGYDITSPSLALPRLAHTGIEAIMSHPENVINITIATTNTYGEGLGTKVIEEGITLDDAIYVYVMANTLRMALGGTPSIFFELKNRDNLSRMKDIIIEALGKFKAMLESKGNLDNKLALSGVKVTQNYTSTSSAIQGAQLELQDNIPGWSNSLVKGYAGTADSWGYVVENSHSNLQQDIANQYKERLVGNIHLAVTMVSAKFGLTPKQMYELSNWLAGELNAGLNMAVISTEEIFKGTTKAPNLAGASSAITEKSLNELAEALAAFSENKMLHIMGDGGIVPEVSIPWRLVGVFNQFIIAKSDKVGNHDWGILIPRGYPAENIREMLVSVLGDADTQDKAASSAITAQELFDKAFSLLNAERVAYVNDEARQAQEPTRNALVLAQNKLTKGDKNKLISLADIETLRQEGKGLDLAVEHYLMRAYQLLKTKANEASLEVKASASSAVQVKFDATYSSAIPKVVKIDLEDLNSRLQGEQKGTIHLTKRWIKEVNKPDYARQMGSLSSLLRMLIAVANDETILEYGSNKVKLDKDWVRNILAGYGLNNIEVDDTLEYIRDSLNKKEVVSFNFLGASSALENVNIKETITFLSNSLGSVIKDTGPDSERTLLWSSGWTFQLAKLYSQPGDDIDLTEVVIFDDEGRERGSINLKDEEAKEALGLDPLVLKYKAIERLNFESVIASSAVEASSDKTIKTVLKTIFQDPETKILEMKSEVDRGTMLELKIVKKDNTDIVMPLGGLEGNIYTDEIYDMFKGFGKTFEVGLSTMTLSNIVIYKAVRKSSSAIELGQPQDPALRAGSMPETEQIGGIDFRSTPMTIQPMGIFKGLNFQLPQLSQAELNSIDIPLEVKRVQNMVASGTSPSGEWIKRLVAACKLKQQSNYINDLFICLLDGFKIEEENALESTPDSREALVVLDSVS